MARSRPLYAAVATAIFLGLAELAGRLALPAPETLASDGIDIPYDPGATLVAEGADGRRSFARAAFHAAEWTVPAPDGTFRVGLVGDSTPYGPFGLYLDAGLRVPGRARQVLNFGVRALASDRVRIVTDTALEQDLDLLVVYVGHNEHLHRRLNPDAIVPVSQRPGAFLLASGLGRLLQASLHTLATGGPKGPDPRELGPVTPEESAAVQATLAENLAAICADARAANVPVAFVLPISSLLHAPELAPAEDPGNDRQRVMRLAMEALRRDPAADLDASVATLQRMAPESAPTRYLEGLQAVRAGDREAGIAALRAARLGDQHPWRVTEPLASVIERTGAACGATVVPTEPTFLADPRYLTFGDPLFEDQVHPTSDGARLLARAVVAGLAPVLPRNSTWVDPGNLVGPAHTDQERGWRVPAR